MPARSDGSISSRMLRSSARALGGLGPPLVADWPRLADLAVDLVALGLDDLAQLLGDLVVDAAEVEAVEPLLALAAQPLEQVADALDVLALPVLEPLLQQAAQRRVQVAVVEEVVGDLLEDRVGVEVEADLGAVPAAVAEPRRRHGATVSAPEPALGGDPGGSGGSPASRDRAGRRMVAA